MILHMDYESLSRVDLIKHGLYRYAKDPSTQILMLAWAFDDDDPVLWWPEQSPLPREVYEHLSRGEPRSVHAHNAAFERVMTQHCLSRMMRELWDQDIPETNVSAWYCTASQARARALPASLDNLGRCLKLRTQKDKRGKELIRKLSIPWTAGKIDWENGEFNNDPSLMREFGEYCLQDVVVERAAEECSPALSDIEFADYVINEMVNDRGVGIDVNFAIAATAYADDELADIHEQISLLTNGEITSARQFARVKDWAAPYMEQDDRIRKIVTRHKTDRRTDETKVTISFDRFARANLLELEDVDNDFIEMIELLEQAGSTSVSKFKSMVARAGEDGRLRGAFIYSGAGQTKRFSSTGAQLHNMKRDVMPGFHGIRKAVMNNLELDTPMKTLARCLRPTIKARKGKRLVAGDYAQIEARCLPWLANAATRLKMYADGIDVYTVTAESIYPGRGLEMRQIGKVTELALGFQGGPNALQTMARNYEIVIELAERKRIVGTWRRRNQWAVDFWKGLDKAAMKAVRDPGSVQGAEKVSYVYDKAWDMLFCLLPGELVITYPRPRVEYNEEFQSYYLTAIKAAWTPAEGDTEWPRVNLYGGLMAENATQSIAGEILRYAMRQLDRAPIVAHVHDEVVLEVPAANAKMWEKRLDKAMRKRAPWMAGLPIDVATYVNTVYAKK